MIIRMRLHFNIKNKKFLIQWLLLLGVLFFLSAMVALNLYVNHQRTLERESDRLETQARVLAENIQSQLGSANNALQAATNKLKHLQSNKQPNKQHLSDVELQLKTIADSIPGVSYVGILDADGKLLYSNIPQYIGQNFAYRPYFSAVKTQPSENTLYISSPFKNKLNEYVISVSRMVAKPDGSFNGMVTATLDPKYFTTLMRSVLYAPDMWDAIAHGDGELFLMQPPHEMFYGTNMARPGSMFSQHQTSGKAATVFAGVVQVTNEFRLIAQHTVQADAWGADNTLVAASVVITMLYLKNGAMIL